MVPPPPTRMISLFVPTFNSTNTVPFCWHTFGFWLVMAIFDVPRFRSRMWPLCHQFSLFFCCFCSISYIRFVLLNQLQSSDIFHFSFQICTRSTHVNTVMVPFDDLLFSLSRKSYSFNGVALAWEVAYAYWWSIGRSADDIFFTLLLVACTYCCTMTVLLHVQYYELSHLFFSFHVIRQL